MVSMALPVVLVWHTGGRDRVLTGGLQLVLLPGELHWGLEGHLKSVLSWRQVGLHVQDVSGQSLIMDELHN